MLNIKEIALKIAEEMPSGFLWYEGCGHEAGILIEEVVEFAESLVAEIAKQNEPVALTNSAQLGYVTSGQHQDIPLAMWSRNTSYSGADIPLYALPPTAEQIANETAEAIAKMLEGGSFLSTESKVALAANGAAKAVRSGAWKEFKK